MTERTQVELLLDSLKWVGQDKLMKYGPSVVFTLLILYSVFEAAQVPMPDWADRILAVLVGLLGAAGGWFMRQAADAPDA